MAPADLSPPGSASYSSDTLVVGDGTWDFTKNTFLLPNLVGLNFDTMQYNGMGNRFSTVAQYHSLVLAHGVIAAISFLFIVPAAVFIARYYTGKPGYAIRFHSYLLVLAVGLTTVSFILGWFAVGPNRSLTNPHHGIGVAIYVLILVQAIGGRLVKNIKGRSVRVTLHQWSGRAIALLGIVQVPLGLTLYGSPRHLFILYTLWMTFLLVLYFVLSYRAEGRRDRREEYYMGGARSDGGRSRVDSGRTDEKSSRSGVLKWLGPLAAGAGALAFFNRKRNSSRSRAGSRAGSRSRSRSRGPEVVPSRHGSEDFVDDEKFSDRRKNEGTSFMTKVAGVGAAVGAGALFSRWLKNRNERRTDDTEYSAVSTDTPSRHGRSSRPPPRRDETVYTVDTEETDSRRDDRRRPGLLPAPRPGGGQGGGRPVTPPPSHRRTHSRPEDSFVNSDYSSYRSPSRRTPPKSGGGTAGNVGKGLLAGLGVGWFAKKMKDRRDKKEEERLRLEDEERRTGSRPPRYTGDGYGGSPSRRDSRRRPPVSRPSASGVSELSESEIEPRPPTGYGGPPVPVPVPMPMPGSGPAPVPAPVPYPQTGGGSGPPPVGVAGPSRSRSRSRDYATMPAMPPDPHGVLYDSGSDAYHSGAGGIARRSSSRRRREGEAAAAAAVATASRLASDEERRRGGPGPSAAGRGPGSPSGGPSQPVTIKMKVHDDRDRNVTLRRLTEEEQAASSRRDARRHRRAGSTVSSLSGGDESPSAGRQRYRRDSSMRRAEASAERRVEDGAGFPPPGFAPLSPPNPAFAQGAGRSRPAGKDSAYYSGAAAGGAAAGPSSSAAGLPGGSGAMPGAGPSVSSFGSPASHGTWSGVSPSPSGLVVDPTASASAADRSRRRRLERRAAASRMPGAAGAGAGPGGPPVDFT